MIILSYKTPIKTIINLLYGPKYFELYDGNANFAKKPYRNVKPFLGQLTMYANNSNDDEIQIPKEELRRYFDNSKIVNNKFVNTKKIKSMLPNGLKTNFIRFEGSNFEFEHVSKKIDELNFGILKCTKVGKPTKREISVYGNRGFINFRVFDNYQDALNDYLKSYDENIQERQNYYYNQIKALDKQKQALHDEFH